MAGNDARQDRDHRQHAGRERQREPPEIEPAEQRPPRAVDDAGRPLILLGDRCRGGGCGGARRRGGELARRRQHEGHRLLAGRVADAALLAALVAAREHYVHGVGTRARERHHGLDVVVVDVDVAEAVVFVAFTGRQRHAAELDLAVDAERKLVLVQVIARRNLPADRELVRAVEAGIHLESLLRRQQALIVPGGRAVGAEQGGGSRGRRGRLGLRRRQAHIGRPILGRVAQTEVRAALQLEQNLDRIGAARALVGQRDVEFAAIDLLLAEKLIVVSFALRESGRTKRHAGRAAVETEALTIEVVTVENVEMQANLVAVGVGRIAKYLLRGQNVLAERGRCDRRDEQAREDV